jgi:hypothetical protein
LLGGSTTVLGGSSTALTAGVVTGVAGAASTAVDDADADDGAVVVVGVEEVSSRPASLSAPVQPPTTTTPRNTSSKHRIRDPPVVREVDIGTCFTLSPQQSNPQLARTRAGPKSGCEHRHQRSPLLSNYQKRPSDATSSSDLMIRLGWPGCSPVVAIDISTPSVNAVVVIATRSVARNPLPSRPTRYALLDELLG